MAANRHEKVLIGHCLQRRSTGRSARWLRYRPPRPGWELPARPQGAPGNRRSEGQGTGAEIRAKPAEAR